MSGQVWPLLVLRWATVRETRVRVAFIGAAMLLLMLLAFIVATRAGLPPTALATVVQVAPATFLGFALLAIVAPLASGSSADLFPAEQLVAFPIQPRTRFQMALLLAPMNLVWILQLVTLFALTCWLAQRISGLPFAIILTLLYVIMVTALGQVVAWAVYGARQTVVGQRLLWLLIAVLALFTARAVSNGDAARVANNLPLEPVPRLLQHGQFQRYDDWALAAGLLLLASAVLIAAGTAVCGWALRQHAAPTQRDTPVVRRRQPKSSPLREAIAVTRASAWRAVPVRRGAIVLGVLPAAAAAGLEFPWNSLIAVVAVIAAGGGLLFGINVFCLDGPGAVWLSSTPHPPRMWLLAKVVVIAETVGAAAGFVLIAGAIRAPEQPTAVEAAAALGCAVTATIVVTATCVSMSIRHPHRADLLTARDAPAPPGAMLAHSARLTGSALAIAAAMSFSVYGAQWMLSLGLAIALSALGVMSLHRSARAWDDPRVRARVVASVSSG